LKRHVFLTDDDASVRLEDLIRVCYVFPFQSIPDLAAWLSLSPDHFYIRYRFPSMDVKSWADKRSVPYEDLHVCTHCCREKLYRHKLTEEFLAQAKKKPLPTLDLFGGVGAFSLGIAEGSSCINVTHAIEISPSAAKTFK
jgi:DNA (cytosine-5)-methyltransferase 1